MRVVFLGNAPSAVPALEALAASAHEVAVVVTRSPRPVRRGKGTQPTPVARTARELGLALAEVETVKEGPGLDAIREAAPDILAVAAYGEILPVQVLEVPLVAPVNVHYSLLPELRGAAPVQRAILQGLVTTGVTTIRMDEGMDTGPILLQATEPIDPQDDSGSLGKRLSALGGRLLAETLDRLAEGSLEGRRQEEARASYAPKVGPEDRRVEWNDPAALVVRRVRAMAPEPAATTELGGRALKVLRASVLEETALDHSPRGPGEVALVSAETLAVAAGRGMVSLEEVAPAGRGRMSGPDFARGFRIRVGDQFG